mmetsp:Transcript_71124/g.164450  ORF Transcript_71124/g.164450 Transcript_71124/m.164450 type:complete len:242 (+) Transcript_71124:377-1102(+)
MPRVDDVRELPVQLQEVGLSTPEEELQLRVTHLPSAHELALATCFGPLLLHEPQLGLGDPAEDLRLLGRLGLRVTPSWAGASLKGASAAGKECTTAAGVALRATSGHHGSGGLELLCLPLELPRFGLCCLGTSRCFRYCAARILWLGPGMRLSPSLLQRCPECLRRLQRSLRGDAACAVSRCARGRRACLRNLRRDLERRHLAQLAHRLPCGLPLLSRLLKLLIDLVEESADVLVHLLQRP